MDIEILVMADAKVHTAEHNQHARYKQYEIVDVFQVGKLQQQQGVFVTIIVTATAFASLHDAKAYLLESVTEGRTDPITGDFEVFTLHRRKWMLDLVEHSIDLLLDRTITLTWDNLPISERPYA